MAAPKRYVVPLRVPARAKAVDDPTHPDGGRLYPAVARFVRNILAAVLGAGPAADAFFVALPLAGRGAPRRDAYSAQIAVTWFSGTSAEWSDALANRLAVGRL